MADNVELSRPFKIDSRNLKGNTEQIEATEQECQQLAKRLEVITLNYLRAKVKILAGVDDVITVTGSLDAEVTQTCVVSGGKIVNPVSTTFELQFSESSPYKESDDDDVDFQEEQPPEPIENGIIDLGEIVSQFLSMEIDPYPRTAGLPYSDYSDDQNSKEGENADHPFSALAVLKDKLQ